MTTQHVNILKLDKMDIYHNLVCGCPLCEIFLNPEDNLHTKLYYPENPKDIKTCDYIVIECQTCKVPMFVIRDHVNSISSDLWGRILKTSRELFGYNVRLRTKPRTIKNHWHAHVIEKKSDKYSYS